MFTIKKKKKKKKEQKEVKETSFKLVSLIHLCMKQSKTNLSKKNEAV